ncbi:MAG: SusD/RagB family nutrient-binding outer membrane lipoprotein [Tannerellaceae bacterium]|jgi:hypothetical protein|nr:SusD/RagB family nutrient-binding outer membrane lipoprotein [Tannerellaceae bacterium]
MKRKIFHIILAVSLLFTISSCNNFGDVNIDPEHITGGGMDFRLLFTGVQVGISGTEWEVWRNGMIYSSTMMQHCASTQSYWNGDKYTYNSGYNSAYWDRYTSTGRNLAEVLNAWKDDETKSNAYQMTRILKVMLFHRMTDMYGDIPYSEAGQGFISNLFYPKYDRQEDIYADMLNELKEAAEALDASKTNTIGGADLIYNGDPVKWKKFACSLMIRLAMRLSKVNPEQAKTWMNTAVAGGIFQGNADNAIIRHDYDSNDSSDAFGKIAVHSDPNAYRLSQTFIDHLKNTQDPRLIYIATVCENPAPSWSTPNFELGDTAYYKQLGMPNGYDELGGETDISKASNWPGNMNNYSVINRYTYGRLDAPTFLITYAQINLLLAEAAHRGWIGGDEESYYTTAVTAAMEQFREYGVAGIPQDQIDGYLKTNPYSTAYALEQINTQYWVVAFMDEYEVFANWRRSGYPVLKPVNYFANATNGTIPRRFTYPESESTANSANYMEAVSRLSDGDRMTSRVWWDKE